MLSNEEVIAGTLAWCNERRAARDKHLLTELPKGRRGDPESCPCGKATGLSVGLSTYVDPANPTAGRIGIPQHVRAFVERFDAGLIPELVEKNY